MLKLIALEIRKNKLASMLKGVLITNLAILAFMILIIFIGQSEAEVTFNSYPEMLDGLSIFVKATFIVFAAILLSRLVIDEYKNNTVSLLFMYPIPRKKLMFAKLIIVFLFTLINIILSNVVLGTLLIGIMQYTNTISGQITLDLLTTNLIKTGANAVYAAGISLIPLYVGMRKKSVPATIVTAVFVVSLISSGSENFQLGNLVGVSIFLGVLGMFIAYLSIRNVETADID